MLYPLWTEQYDQTKENDRFIEAISLATEEFFISLDYCIRAWLPAYEIVLNAVNTASKIHNSGKIIYIETFCSWKEHLYAIEKILNIEGHILFVLFKDTKNNWRVQAVPNQYSEFDQRQSLKWKGLRDESLSTESGIDHCIFVHSSGFIGGNKTFEGALNMAIKSMQ